MLKLLRNLRRQEWAMAAVCAVLILGQIYFDLALPDYMSSLTVLIKTPGSTLSDILHTGLEMLGCTLASAVLCVICGYLTAKVAAGFSFSIREAVFHKIADFGQQEMMAFSVPTGISLCTQEHCSRTLAISSSRLPASKPSHSGVSAASRARSDSIVSRLVVSAGK